MSNREQSNSNPFSASEISKILLRKINNIRDRLNYLQKEIWKNPETAYQENFAVKLQRSLLRDLGFEVQENYCGMETAYRASYGNGGEQFAFAAEYDALPQLGHACGHNLICAAAVGAAYAAMEFLRENKLPGRVVILGTPAEESGGGKVMMLKQNCLDDIGACMMVHPAGRTTIDRGSMAICRFDVEFHGVSAHASAAPMKGINALDAVMMVFAGVNAWRQHLHETDRIHGVVINGGTAPNIIPDYAKCRFFLRSLQQCGLERMINRFKDIVTGAGLITGATPEISELGVQYQSRIPNSNMNRIYMDSAKSLGLNPEDLGIPSRASTDFGNFSRVKPGIHPSFAIDKNPSIPGHSKEFVYAVNSDMAFENMLKAAAAMGSTGLHFLLDTEFRENVIKEFKSFSKAENT